MLHKDKDDGWTNEMQLLALLIELTSIRVAGKQIKKPIDIPRPGKKAKGKRGQQQGDQRPASKRAEAANRDAAFKQGFETLQATARVR